LQVLPADPADLIHSIVNTALHLLQLWLAQSYALQQHEHDIVVQMLQSLSAVWSFPWADESQPALRQQWLTPGRV
jgi:Na+/melibiose symporter-like transporter